MGPGPLELVVILVVMALFAAVAFFAVVAIARSRDERAASRPTQPLAPGPVGFAVLYRWRLTPGREEDFQVAWERLTRGIAAERGGLGSRLHRGADGVWWAYAQWPSEERWRAAQSHDPVDPESSERMGEAILERFEPILLRPVADLLSPSAKTADPEDAA